MNVRELAMRVTGAKQSAIQAINAQQNALIQMSLSIHSNPELPFKEFKSSKLLSDYLSMNGFRVEYGAYGLETAFEATIGEGFPRIGIMAEYDALPNIGHGCGHNIIGTAAVGAGVALAGIIKELGGQVVVFGTPAEEGGLAKETMAKQGAFKEIDAAMMIHPWNSDMLDCNCGAVVLASVEYFGESAHPCTPEKGINALDAMLVGFGAFNTLRKELLMSASPREALFGAIDDGGVWNYVPHHTTATVAVFGNDENTLKGLLDKVRGCFEAGASATGARIEFRYDWENRAKGMYSNKTMCELFDKNIRVVREKWYPATPTWLIKRAATDMGSVSQAVPSIHVWIATASSDIGWHSIESAAICASQEGHKTLVEGAKAMAMTAIDLIMRPEVLRMARAEFLTITP